MDVPDILDRIPSRHEGPDPDSGVPYFLRQRAPYTKKYFFENLTLRFMNK
jgi:hypothetical protein